MLPYIGIEKEKSAVDAVTSGTPGPKPTAGQKPAGRPEARQHYARNPGLELAPA